MKKMLLLLTVLSLLCWLPGQALATGALDTFVSTLDTRSTCDSGFPNLTNYGTVTVYRMSNTTANVVFDIVNSPDFDFKLLYSAAWLNVAGTATATYSTGWVAGSTLNPDNLGTFDVAARYTGSDTDVNSLTINLTRTDGTWAFATAVLECNDKGFDAGARLVADYVSGNPEGYVGESCVPLPGAVLLLGGGMARLIAYRRKRQV